MATPTNTAGTIHGQSTLPEMKAPKPISIKVVREVYGKDCTIGKMYIDNVFFAHTLEDFCRHINGDITKKVAGKTCIDAGTYAVTVSMSNRFKKILPLLHKVPCFEAIRIHGGNTHADTEGCLLVGSQTDGVGKVWDCATKVAELTKRISTSSAATITIA